MIGIVYCEISLPLQPSMVATINLKTHCQTGCVYLALVLLVAHPEFDIRVAQAIGIHRLEAATFDETDADYTSPQLSFSVHI